MNQEQLQRAVRLFIGFCQQNFGFDLYEYQLRVATACLSSILVEPKDVYIRIARQSGKTETVTLLLRFLIIFYFLLAGSPLRCGIASPRGEQAKTDIDRVKFSIQKLREKWGITDKEFNAATIRAYMGNTLHAEAFKFSLAPTTSNESKTLNLLIVEEAHKADDTKRSNELDPMLASTGGVTWMIGVGCTRTCDFKKGCDGDLPDSEAIIVDVNQVIADRRKKYEESGEEKHLEYEKAFQRELRKKGKDNPEIRLNYFLHDLIEEGNFIGRERLLSRRRPTGATVSTDKLFLGIDWGRVSDSTCAALVNNKNDLVDMIKLPSVQYEQQIELLKDWLEPRIENICGVKGDSTGQGDMPMEVLANNTRLPMDATSHVKFTLQSKNEMYVNFEACLFREEDGFTYDGNHPLASEFEEQMTKLVREYKGDGEYLSVHHPDEPGAKDDMPDCVALALLAAKEGDIGELLIA